MRIVYLWERENRIEVLLTYVAVDGIFIKSNFRFDRYCIQIITKKKLFIVKINELSDYIYVRDWRENWRKKTCRAYIKKCDICSWKGRKEKLRDTLFQKSK